MALFVELEAGQTIEIDGVRITLQEKSGRKARLAVETPKKDSGRRVLKLPERKDRLESEKGERPIRMPAQ